MTDHSQSAAQPGTVKRSGSWRGKTQTEPRVRPHGWHHTIEALPLKNLRRRRAVRWIWTIGLLVASLLLLGMFVNSLLFAPTQTPFFAVIATDYEPPLIPNAWSPEDLRALQDPSTGLDKKTLAVADLSSSWSSKHKGLQELEAQLRDASRLGVEREACIIYLSLHGTVDGAGNPCLIPPGASPTRSETWLPVRELLTRIRGLNLPDHTLKLVVFDANRILVNWGTGTLFNTFADQLSQEVDRARIPNLAVLNSTSPGQTGWASRELRSSVFGYYLRMGLAGEADAWAHGGNGDRRVSLGELHRYLGAQVDQWARQNRGARQQPLLIPADADGLLTWSLNPVSQRQLIEQSILASQTSAAIPLDEIKQLWNDWTELQSLQAVRYDPVGASRIERKLLWLEQAAVAGNSYVATGRDVQRELQYLFQRVRERAAKSATPQAFPIGSSLFTDDPPALPDSGHFHSVPLAAYFGKVSKSTVDEAALALTKFQQVPAAPGLAAALAEYARDPALAAMVEPYYLELLQRYEVPKWCPDPATLAASAEVRALGDQVSVPADERTLHWLRGAVAAADATRRAGEDQLFCGLPAAGQAFDSARQQYAAARHLSDSAAQALIVRDRVWAELPYLAQWVAAPGRGGGSPQEQDHLIDQTLLPLIDMSDLLGLSLARGPQARVYDVADVLPFQGQLDETQRNYEKLRNLIDEEYGSLLGAIRQEASLFARLNALLAIPLLPREKPKQELSPVEQRMKLLALSMQLSAELYDQAGKVDARGEPPNASRELPSDHADFIDWMVSRWEEHPAIAILSTDNQAFMETSGKRPIRGTRPAANPLLTLADMGRQVRDRLHSIPLGIEQNRGLFYPTPEEFRHEWQLTGRLLRTAAPIWLRPLDDDPIPDLRCIDLQQLVLWQCRRALDDFWGPAPCNERSFFEIVAADYLHVARLLSDPNPAVQQQLDELNRQLQARILAARQGLNPSAADVLLLQEVAQVTANVTVAAGPAAARAGLPDGQATVFVRTSTGAEPSQRQPVKLPLPPNAAPPHTVQLALPLNRGLLAAAGPMLSATTLFRGHEFPAPFVVSASGGTVADYALQIFDEARVTVLSGARQRASVVFVLDCSNSMSRPMLLESPGPQVPRLDVAKSALSRMLDQLADRGNARVGALFLGHRVGWNTKQSNQLLLQTDYAGTIPAGVLPSTDVETVLPLGRFDASWAGQVDDRLGTVKAWGESPLYLAIIQALGEFGEADAENERTVVVITDGLNYQFNPAPADDKQLSDVLGVAKQQQAAIHIVGFGIPDNQAEAARQQFGTLATATNGSYVPADRATTLIETLERILELRKYAATSPDGTTTLTDSGLPTVIHDSFTKPLPMTLTLGPAAAQVELSGGDALEFNASADGRRLEVPPYTKGLPEFVPLVTEPAGRPTGFELGLHRPIREAGGGLFEFSIQGTQREFTPRPLEVWIEMAPVLPDNQVSTARYIFYDPVFAEGKPVPVLRPRAGGWPAGARQARVSFWCKSQATEPLQTIPLQGTTGSPDATETTREILPGIRLQWRVRPGEVDRVDVVEWHSKDSPGIDALRVSLQSPRRITRIVHRFDSEHNVVAHTFLLGGDAEPAPASQPPTLVLTTKRAILAEAWRLPEPVLLDLSDSGNLIPLSGPRIAP